MISIPLFDDLYCFVIAPEGFGVEGYFIKDFGNLVIFFVVYEDREERKCSQGAFFPLPVDVKVFVVLFSPDLGCK